MCLGFLNDNPPVFWRREVEISYQRAPLASEREVARHSPRRTDSRAAGRNRPPGETRIEAADLGSPDPEETQDKEQSLHMERLCSPLSATRPPRELSGSSRAWHPIFHRSLDVLHTPEVRDVLAC